MSLLQAIKDSLLLPESVAYAEKQNTARDHDDYAWTCVRLRLTMSQRETIERMFKFGWQIVGVIRNESNAQSIVMREPESMDLAVVYPKDVRPERHDRSLGVLRSDWQLASKPRTPAAPQPIYCAHDQFKSSVGLDAQFWEE